MDLTTLAKEAYEKEKAITAARLGRMATEFAARAANAFVNQMQIEKGLVGFNATSSMTASSCATNPVIEARELFDAVEFYAIVPCPLCGDKGHRRVATLADIGLAIDQGYTQCSCTAAPFSPRSERDPLERIADALEKIVSVFERSHA